MLPSRSRPGTLARVLDQFMPDLIANLAAYTAVDLAEDEREEAFCINSDGFGSVCEMRR